MGKKKQPPRGGGKGPSFLLPAAVVGLLLAVVAFLLWPRAKGGSELIRIPAVKKPSKLTTKDPSRLTEVFTSSAGDTWVVWCSDSQGSGIDGTPVEDIVAQLAIAFADEAKVGTLNCKGLLPSGRDVYDKLKLNESVAPVMFLSAPKYSRDGSVIPRKPGQLSLDKISVDSILKIVRKTTAPSLQSVTSAAKLKERCWSLKWCVLILSNGPLQEPHKSDVVELMRPHHKKIGFASVDISEFDLKFEPQILPNDLDTEPAMVIIRRETLKADQFVLYAGLHRGDLRESGAGMVIREIIAAKSSKKPSPAVEGAPSPPGKWGLVALNGPPVMPLGVGEKKELEERQKKADREREKQRREQMDKEAEASLGIEEVASEEEPVLDDDDDRDSKTGGAKGSADDVSDDHDNGHHDLGMVLEEIDNRDQDQGGAEEEAEEVTLEDDDE